VRVLAGGIVKLANFNEALAEMNHFGVSPAMPFAIAVIALELVASVAILTGYWRWLGALALGAFTVAASLWPIDTGSLGRRSDSRQRMLSTSIWDSPAASFWLRGTTYVIEHIESLPHES